MTGPPWHRTKIVCTLGPATDAPGVVARLIESGMDVARINASHGNHADHARRIQLVRRSARESGRPVAILIDLPGPKFRIGALPDGCCMLEEGTIVALAAEDDIAEAGSVPKEGDNLLPVRDPELLAVLRAGESVFLADGSIDLRVKESAANASHVRRIQCEVRVGGIVRSGSGINLPESTLNELVPTDDDRRHLAFAVSQEAEWVGVSFVQSVDDLVRVRALLPVGAQPLLMAKIEKRRALANLGKIVEAADGVMVARGDLGVETDLAEIPIVQKRIIAMANAWARPVITATQMLESMVEHEYPTRAEVTDVANAVLDGTDAVMLSAETAIGQFPVAAVKILHRVLTATEAAYGEPGRGESGYGRGGAQDMRPSAASGSPEDALSFAACQLSARLNACAIIVSACNLRTVLGIARFRPGVPLVIITDSARLYRSLAIVHGVAPLFSGAPGLIEPHLCTAQAREWLFAQALAQPGDQAVVLSASGISIGVAGEEADTLQAVRLVRQ